MLGYNGVAVPELPDVELYVEALRARVLGSTLKRVRLASPFLLRTASPPLTRVEGGHVAAVLRVGKRIVIRLECPEPGPRNAEGPLFLVLHLMIAGRLHWKEEPGAKIPGKIGMAAFDFPSGTLLLTEAGTKRRASLHLVRGQQALEEVADRGGLEVLEAGLPPFRDALLRESHTLKRALTDPTLFSGIGNAYSDEILHRARLSPVKLTRSLTDAEIERLYLATRDVLSEWIVRLRAQFGGQFPEKVTAFRREMAVHGRFGQPCPVCGTAVQRIVHAENECDYCPTCQTGGRLLADRALSRLLKGDWPRTVEELEARRAAARTSERRA